MLREEGRFNSVVNRSFSDFGGLSFEEHCILLGIWVVQTVIQVADVLSSVLQVRAPDGLAQTHRFATQSVDVPAQEGERVTMVLASPSNAGRGLGPIRFNARAPGWKPREPMAVTNHVTGQVLGLMRAPPKAGSKAAFDTSVILPVAILLASTDAASGLIDPSLPRLVAVGAAAAVTVGGAVNTFVLPRLNQVLELLVWVSVLTL